jgi:hypothetical protein
MIEAPANKNCMHIIVHAIFRLFSTRLLIYLEHCFSLFHRKGDVSAPCPNLYRYTSSV